jgi:glycosyltransferase involved in cell wall biosynthesis
MIQRWIILAGEEAGPASNKMGGIWEVINSEAKTLAGLAATGVIEKDIMILVAGPYYPTPGSDWNRGTNRVTDVSGMDKLNMGPEMETILSRLSSGGIEVVTAQVDVQGVPVGYVLFNTTYYQSRHTMFRGKETTLSNAITTEAYGLVGLDSLSYEGNSYGPEYLHCLHTSYAISELVRNLATYTEATIEKYSDKAVSEFAKAVMPKNRISLHCHEFGVFYAMARLKKLGIPFRGVDTFHATVPGRTAGYKVMIKVAKNDPRWEPGTPQGLAVLEALARYADVTTFVGDSTMKEALLFYNLKGIIIRNGIIVQDDDIDWAKKDRCRDKIQKFLAENIHKFCGGTPQDHGNILPVFTISRIEVENKGYPQLLDALVLQDHLLKHRITGLRRSEDVKVVCFLIAAHGLKPKDKLPEGFPVNLPLELLVGDEIRLQNMIQERGLGDCQLANGKRNVVAILYPQWVGSDDGGLDMRSDEIMAGCIAGIFPSQYEPFLFTALEAGKEGTPSVVSRVAGLSDALKKVKRLVPGLGGVIIVDNMNTLAQEAIADYALGLDYFTWTYLEDKVKYRLLCEESFSLAKQMDWTKPVLEYYRNLVV